MADLKIEKIDAEAYSKFLANNPPSSPFSLPEFLAAYRETFSTESELLSINRNDSTVAVCALFVGRRAGQKLVKLMPIRPYDGVHFRSLESSTNQKREYDVLTALQALAEYLKRNFAFYQMVFPPDTSDIRAFQWDGAQVVTNYTYVMDLPGFTEDGYTKSLREVLRGAQNSGLAGGMCGVEELVSLQQLSYERHGRRPPVSAGNLLALLKQLDAAGLLRTRCVRNKNGRVVSAMTSLIRGRGTYLYVSGTDAIAERGASHLLYHNILNEEKREGKIFVDFCGANTPSINLFKSAFGPRLAAYFRVWRANTLITRLASRFKKF